MALRCERIPQATADELPVVDFGEVLADESYQFDPENPVKINLGPTAFGDALVHQDNLEVADAFVEATRLDFDDAIAVIRWLNRDAEMLSEVVETRGVEAGLSYARESMQKAGLRPTVIARALHWYTERLK